MHSPTDLRVFHTIERDHALYDACLLSVHQRFTNWNRSELGGCVPLAIDHFREDARRRIREFIRGRADLGTQDTSDKRLLLSHLAFTFLHASGKMLHARGEGFDSMLREIRNDLRSILLSHHMNVEMEDHPLHDHYKARAERFIVSEGGNDVSKIQKAIGATEPDLAVARALLGNSPRDTLDAVNGIHPWLAEVDASHYRTAVPELRKHLLSYVGRHPLLLPEERRRLVDTIVADWKENVQPADMEALDELEGRVSKERGIENVFNLAPQELIDHCFTPLIAENMPPATVRELVRRRPVFNHILMHAAETADGKLMSNLGDSLKVYTRRAGLDFIDLPHAHLVIGAFAMEADDFRNFLR